MNSKDKLISYQKLFLFHFSNDRIFISFLAKTVIDDIITKSEKGSISNALTDFVINISFFDGLSLKLFRKF